MSNQPLGTGGDSGRRLLRHHLPLALASAFALILLMALPTFDASRYPIGDIFSGAFPQERSGEHTGPMNHGPDQAGPMDHGAHGHGPMRHGGQDTLSLTPSADQVRHRSFNRQLTVASGYVALGLLGLTLLIGPANLLLRKPNPVSSYLRRDVGTWVAILSVVHVLFGLQVHGTGRISGFLNYFIAPDGGPWLNSFGLANWTGLGALVIVVGLLAVSSNVALRKLKGRPWKRLQRLNYALFALVVVHAFFYGALLRVTSLFTFLLGMCVVAVFVGQAAGIWLWRRRASRTVSTPA
jgi:sulfoxide reductase heme-binding subunit YedZ